MPVSQVYLNDQLHDLIKRRADEDGISSAKFIALMVADVVATGRLQSVAAMRGDREASDIALVGQIEGLVRSGVTGVPDIDKALMQPRGTVVRLYDRFDSGFSKTMTLDGKGHVRLKST